MTTLKQATEWLQEYFQINKMYFPVEEIYLPIEKIKSNFSYWENEVCTWELYIYCEKANISVEYINKSKFYDFIVPNTKEDFFTVLNILEK